jgi:putative flippase GtrA
MGPCGGILAPSDREERSPQTMLISALRTHLPQFARYGVVGAVNTALTYAVYVLCLDTGVWYVAASALGFIVGAVNGYVFNRRWTFRAGGAHAPTMARYVLVQAAALGSNLLLLTAFVEVADLSKLDSQAVVLPVVAVCSFIVNRQWTFGVPTAADEPAA